MFSTGSDIFFTAPSQFNLMLLSGIGKSLYLTTTSKLDLTLHIQVEMAHQHYQSELIKE